MKSSSTVVTIVVIAAVLIGAYGVGLLIHRARMGESEPSTPTATEVNETSVREATAKLVHGPGAGKSKDTAEMRAKLKEKRAEALQKMESATPEEKERIKQQIRERFTATRRGRPGQTMPAAQPKPSATAPQTNDPNGEVTGAEPNAAGQR